MTQDMKHTERQKRVAYKDKKSGMTQGQKHVVPRHKECKRDLFFDVFLAMTHELKKHRPTHVRHTKLKDTQKPNACTKNRTHGRQQ